MLAGQKLFTIAKIDFFDLIIVKRTEEIRSNTASVKRYGHLSTQTRLL